MRKGKTTEFNMDQYKEFYCESGSVDANNYKSLYLKMQAHLFCEEDEGLQELKYFYWGIKQSISKCLDDKEYKKEFLSDMTYSETFKEKPYTYIIFDFTIFPLQKNLRSYHTQKMNQIVERIYQENILFTPFKLYKQKKDFILENKNIDCIRTSH